MLRGGEMITVLVGLLCPREHEKTNTKAPILIYIYLHIRSSRHHAPSGLTIPYPNA